MSAVYQCEFTPDQTKILEEMRGKLTKEFGITLQGNRVTLRWGKQLAEVHMIIESIEAPEDKQEAERQRKEMDALYKKYPQLRAELFHVEYGETPQ